MGVTFQSGLPVLAARAGGMAAAITVHANNHSQAEEPWPLLRLEDEVRVADRGGAQERGEVMQPAGSVAVRVVGEEAIALVVDDLRVRLRRMAKVEMSRIELAKRPEHGEVAQRQHDRVVAVRELLDLLELAGERAVEDEPVVAGAGRDDVAAAADMDLGATLAEHDLVVAGGGDCSRGAAGAVEGVVAAAQQQNLSEDRSLVDDHRGTVVVDEHIADDFAAIGQVKNRVCNDRPRRPDYAGADQIRDVDRK